MFEAKLANAGLLKKIVESIKVFISNFCETGILEFAGSRHGRPIRLLRNRHESSSHGFLPRSPCVTETGGLLAIFSSKFQQWCFQVGLFDTYRCDRTINLGLSLANMSKALKCANNDDTCMLKVQTIFHNSFQ